MRAFCLTLAFWLAAAPPVPAVVLDRIAVTIGKYVITEGEVLDEIRMTAFLNGDKPDYSPEARRKAAERLVDQYLVRNEMRVSNYPQPETSEAEKMLAQLKRNRFRGDAPYRQALNQYGITEHSLLQHLLWQLAALRFTDYRFRPGAPEPNAAVARHLERRAETRAAQEAGGRANIRTDNEQEDLAPKAVPPSVDEQLDAWLKQARSRTRVVFHKEAFQ